MNSINSFYEDMAPSIEERLHQSFKSLKNSKSYRELKAIYDAKLNELYNFLGNNQEILDDFKDVFYIMSSRETHNAYVIGFYDGIKLDKNLKKLN